MKSTWTLFRSIIKVKRGVGNETGTMAITRMLFGICLCYRRKRSDSTHYQKQTSVLLLSDCGEGFFPPSWSLHPNNPIFTNWRRKLFSLLLISRKWFCDNPICDRKIFTERYAWILRMAVGQHERRVLREIAFRASCLNGEKLARTVYLPVSHDTLLSIIKKTGNHPCYIPFRQT